MKSIKFVLIFAGIILGLGCYSKNKSKDRIQPWTENPWFWQFKGKPVMLLGASSDDNPFQWPAKILVPHLDSMKAPGELEWVAVLSKK